MLQFFCLFHFCILYRVYTSLLHNYLLTHLLAFLHFGIICVFPCFPYFLNCFCALFYCLFCTKSLILTVVDVLQILVGLPSSSSVLFLPACLLFRCFRGFSSFTFVFRFLFVRADGLLLFFLLISCHPFFLQFVVLVGMFVCPCFADLFCLPVCFLAYYLPKHIYPAQRTPYSPSITRLNPLWSP